MRFTEAELQFINSTFGGNSDLLLIIRKFFLQSCSETELKTLSNTMTDETVRVLRKVYFPEIDPNAPVGQTIDFWMTVDFKDKTVEESAIAMETIQTVIDYLTQRFKALKSGSESYNDIRLKDLVYSKGKDPRKAHIQLGARNTIISQVEMNTNQLAVLSGDKKETPDEIKKRLFKDSSK